MKSLKNQRSTIILYLSFLLTLLCSCSTQSHSTHETPSNVEVDLPPSLENQADSSLLLNLKSGIRAILEDRNGNIWFGSHQEGVALFDGKKLTYFDRTDGLSHGQVRSIFEDSNGLVWFEGGIGITSYDGEKIITHPEIDFSSKTNWQAGEDDIWFKGNEGIGYNGMEERPGVYRYDGEKLSYHVFPNLLKTDNSLSVSTPFVKGKNGMFWFGTYGAVIGYDGNSLPSALQPVGKEQNNFTIINDQSLGFDPGFLHVRSLYEDSKGNLWIGNNGIGVLHYDGNTTTHFSKKMGLISQNSLRSGGFRSPPGSLEHVFAIGEDHDGNMWFGDRDTGAWRYDGKTMKNFTKEDGLTSTHIWQIYTTKNGELWFAMGDGNVLKFNPSAEQEGKKPFEKIF